MQTLQANHQSRIGEQFVPIVTEAITMARMIHEEGSDDAPLQRLGPLYDTHANFLQRSNNVLSLVFEWLLGQIGRGNLLHPEPEDKDDAIATMIFNAWYGRYLGGVFSDEGLHPASGFLRATRDVNDHP